MPEYGRQEREWGGGDFAVWRRERFSSRDQWTKYGRPRSGWRYHRPDVGERRKQQKASKRARRANRGAR